MCRIRSIKAIDVFVSFLGLFWTREVVRESLGPEMLYLIYLFLLLKQVCMYEQCLTLNLLRSGNTTLGVL
jgi:hypothetical protein